MLKVGTHFQFPVPEGWKDTKEGFRIVMKGPRQEALIVSGYFIQGEGPGKEKCSLEDRIFQNTISAAYSTVADAELVIDSELARDDTIANLPCWTLLSHSVKEDLFFGQAIFRNSGVLFVTFEGPADEKSLADFRRFLNNVEAASEQLAARDASSGPRCARPLRARP